MIYSSEDKWSFRWDKQLHHDITTISQVRLNTHANLAELGVPTESTNYIWNPTRHAIECFHAYFNNNGSHKDDISGYNYIIKCYLRLLVTFCHALLHNDYVNWKHNFHFSVVGNDSIHQIKVKIRDSSCMYMDATNSFEESHLQCLK